MGHFAAMLNDSIFTDLESLKRPGNFAGGEEIYMYCLCLSAVALNCYNFQPKFDCCLFGKSTLKTSRLS